MRLGSKVHDPETKTQYLSRKHYSFNGWGKHNNYEIMWRSHRQFHFTTRAWFIVSIFPMVLTRNTTWLFTVLLWNTIQHKRPQLRIWKIYHDNATTNELQTHLQFLQDTALSNFSKPPYSPSMFCSTSGFSKLKISFMGMRFENAKYMKMWQSNL